ncbi:DNA-binding protein WhiA, partial [Terribacillus saccharophilus]
MSFASEIKKELTTIPIEMTDVKSELAALIRMNGSVSYSRQEYMLDVQTENAAIARRIYTLLKAIYQHPIELLVRKKMKLKKNNVYIVRLNKQVDDLLRNLEILEDKFTFVRTISTSFTDTAEKRRAYLRGAFLAGGSVNNPETSSYHLEIFNTHKEHS